jgi:hypothetical protein
MRRLTHLGGRGACSRLAEPPPRRRVRALLKTQTTRAQ